MHSTAETALAALEIFNETVSTGDAWIRQRKQPLRPQKSSPKTESLVTQKSSTKLLTRVMHGLDSAKSPCGLLNHQQKLSRRRNSFHE
jgi:hypothetical protein